MQATEVIESYIDDTVRLLPKRQRTDVANELRSLLSDDLQARSRQSGQPADESLALSLVQAYGQPNEVAARYHTPWAIIEPADSTSFVRAAIIGAGGLILFGAISKRLPSLSEKIDDLVTIGILVLLGVLVVAFGAKSWIRRRWPTRMVWKPRDRERVNRLGAALVVPFATCVVVLYAAPAWVLDVVSGGRIDTSSLAYTADFRQARLPCFIGLLAGLIGLLAFAAIHGRRRRLTRRIDIGLNIALAFLTLIFAVDGNIFQSAQADQITRGVLALVAAVYVPCVCAQVYGEFGRVDRAATSNRRTVITPGPHSAASR